VRPPQVPREEEFAPVKNAPGAGSDCPETARAALSALCLARLVAAGGAVRGGDFRVREGNAPGKSIHTHIYIHTYTYTYIYIVIYIVIYSYISARFGAGLSE